MSRRTNEPFSDALLALLTERGLSQRALARAVGVEQSHLSRLLRHADYYVRPSTDLMSRIADALHIPSDFFREYREDVVIGHLGSDANYLNKTYDSLLRAGRSSLPGHR